MSDPFAGLRGRELHRLFPERDRLTTQALHALIGRGVDTRALLEELPDQELLLIRNLGKQGLARIRAVVPYRGVSA